VLIFVDIDETICDTPDDRNYSNSTPIIENINIINKLYDDGNTIVYWTARGSGTGIDWEEVTQNQLKQWGAKHHDVRLGKPSYDMFIDDKAFNSDLFFEKYGLSNENK
tara:strand:- start:13598 stop:13921 length:324 start_codon:yes stop_codon:yes gene_type:complete